MPDPNGFEILERVAARHLPVLAITGHDQQGNAERVRALGGRDYFLKPVNENQLLNAIRAAIKHSLGTIAPGE
jgi:DNA-binding response OmpR family regulator